jgi:thiol:disulfide interchange protein DsbD
MSFVKLAGKKGGRAWADALAFAFGVLATLTVLAVLLFALRSAGSKIGWGFQLQDPRVLFVGGIVFLLFAMNMAGAYEIGLSASGIGAAREKRTKGEFAGSFFSGVLAVVVATPCSAPFLGTAVGYAFARPAWQMLAVFWAVGIGFALPYVILAAFPKLLGFLPKPGAWMEKLRHFLSLFLFATVAYLAWTLMPFIGGGFTYLRLALAALFTILATLLYGKYSQIPECGSHPSPTFAKVRKTRSWPRSVKRYAVPGLLLAAALAVGWPGGAKARDDGSVSRTPVPAFEEGDETPHFTEWRPGLAEKLSAEGHIVWVDFTARWCATCQVNKAVIFASPEVRDAFRRHKVVALKADWTGQDETITRELAKWNRYAVPFNLVYAPGKKPVEMPTLLTPGTVSKALEDASK